MSNTHESKAVVVIKSIANGQLEAKIAAPVHGVVYGEDVAEVLEKVAGVIRGYKSMQSHEDRIAVIDKQMRRLEIERQALADAEPEHLPVYALLDEGVRTLLAANTKAVDTDWQNWYEEKYDVNIISACLFPSPFGNRYGSPLMWDWHILKNKDDDDG